ncbi:hypothetical protein DNTS_025732 [Danionella cerebrum]|uniref:small monomeric GTPase n=1 Tax=Danionella cerebrum TaxID=2873325 RepID=A0A553RD06_9TELE|nr:hypothetical protein DNTS_025732 [Danionella translucida]
MNTVSFPHRSEDIKKWRMGFIRSEEEDLLEGLTGCSGLNQFWFHGMFHLFLESGKHWHCKNCSARPTMAKKYDFLFKLLLIGDSGVGKTCLIIRFAEDNFNSTYISTIGIDFKVKTIEVEGKKVKLQVWDTAGQERFKTITTAYYRGAMNASAGVSRMVLGNKCDVEAKRKVSKETGEKLAKEHGIRFFETSAKSSINVEESFTSLARDILLKSSKKQGPSAREVKLTNPEKKSSSKCLLL